MLVTESRNFTAILEMIGAIERIYNCKICLLNDLHAIQSFFPQIASAHFAEACNIVKGISMDMDYRCINVEGPLSVKHAEMVGHAFFKVCPFGVMEAVAPIMLGHKVAGLLYAGSFKPVKGLGKEEMILPQKEHLFPMSLLRVLSEEEFRELPFMLDTIAGMIGQYAYENATIQKVNGDIRGIIENFLDREFRKPIGLSELAEKLGLSESYLSTRIKKMFDKNFSELLFERRMENAKMLLRDSSYMIRSVGANSGFRDPAFFHRIFRRSCGMTPKEYRALFRKTSEK